MNEDDGAPRRLDGDLLELLRRYPREEWPGHANLGEIARFWLQRHTMFRELDRVIREGTDAARDRQIDPAEFRPWLARHLSLYLGQLEEHHHVEDHHYFPVFRHAEPRLLRGFDLLEADHDAIHEAIGAIAERADLVLSVSPADLADPLARFREVHAGLGRDLIRHLDDEEDLIIPLILDRGEDFLSRS